MPLILVTALVGYVLCFERLLTWGHWHLSDHRFYRSARFEELESLLGQARSRTRLTPMARLLLRAEAAREQTPERREKTLELELLTRMPEVDARIATIGWLGSILPMLGLLGTVSGMIGTFSELALTTSRQVLSQGLSEALWTTEVGLLGALPLLAGHHLLTRLKHRWLNRVEVGMALLFHAPADPPGAEEATEPAAGRAAFSGDRHET